MDAQRVLSRRFIIKACLRLEMDKEFRFRQEHGLQRVPPVSDGRPSEEQILDYLHSADFGLFQCRRVANGDFIVSRVLLCPGLASRPLPLSHLHPRR